MYVHINKTNNKKYFGITKQNPKYRFGSNGCNYKESPHFYSAIIKYGWDNFEHRVLFTVCTKDEACKLEIWLIKRYKTQDREHGYNILAGGQSPSLTEEVKKKISTALIGNKNSFGIKCSEEKKQKIREPQLGRKFTKEHKDKLSKAAHNRHVPCSDEKKLRLSKLYPNKRKIYCYETNTVYESVHECARQLKLIASLVSKVCRGNLHTTGGYHLKYYDNTINA